MDETVKNENVENPEETTSLTKEVTEATTTEIDITVEETVSTVVVPEESETVGEEVAAQPDITKESVIEALKALLDKDGKEIGREELNRLKQQFNMLRREEVAAEKQAFLDGGGTEEDFTPSLDVLEQELITLLDNIRQKKNLWLEVHEKELADNLEKKQAIIAEIEEFAGDTDNVNRSYNRFKELTQQFREMGDVAPEHATAVWKKFQEAEQKFYDQLKINQELRDYDFKKNLEIKKGIIEKAKELAAKAESQATEVADAVNNEIIQSFRSLQDLHELWKMTGPVAKELRDELWESFRTATVTVNKAYQNYFEQRKADEKASEEAKQALLDKAKGIDYEKIKTSKAWENATKEVIEWQAQWKQTGFTSRKVNNALFSQFRAACDEFFKRKSEFYTSLKQLQQENLEKKTALLERALELQDSTDWKNTAKELVKLQNEWKKIGAAPRKVNDELWEKFHSACDNFFNNRKENLKSTLNAEIENLKQKEEVLKQMEALLEENENVKERFAQLQEQWKGIGYVPIKEKNRLSNNYRDVINKIRKKFNLNEMKASLEKFQKNIEDITGDNDKLNRERERLFRFLENKRADLANYVNNLGFFKSKSKNGDGILKEIEHKIHLIEGDIADLEQKISLIDSKLG